MMREATLQTFRALLSYGFIFHRLLFVGVKRSPLMEVMFRQLPELCTLFKMHGCFAILNATQYFGSKGKFPFVRTMRMKCCCSMQIFNGRVTPTFNSV